MARSHIALALPWLVVIGRVFGRLDLRNVDRAFTDVQVYISARVITSIDTSSLVHFTYNHVC
jgi:hypothetical protein